MYDIDTEANGRRGVENKPTAMTPSKQFSTVSPITFKVYEFK